MSKSKKGFTIVELVIVIAVIAILAAVLIPTFSSLIQKANLSSDKQAVREMNLALAADEKLHGMPNDIDTVMQILANAGYNSRNWVCLTSGYKVYWYKQDNRLVLYNASKMLVEYPEEYPADIMAGEHGADKDFFEYDENNQTALKTDLTLTSNGTPASNSQLTSGSAAAVSGLLGIQSSEVTETQKEIYSSIGTALNNDKLKSALGIEGTAYITAAREIKDPNSAATMQVMSVSSDGTKPVLRSDGKGIKENFIYISTNIEGETDPEVISAAQEKAGEYVYTVFTQINAEKLESDATIVIPAGSTIKASNREWKAVQRFSGYFGTEDASNPVIIDGAKLSEATSYSQTVRMNGSQSKYFISGYFGMLYGDALVENLVFKNIILDRPANDYELSKSDISGGLTNSRNTVAIIGGITDNSDTEDNIVANCNVTVRNIKVESSCTVTSGGCAGGLIGYIGSMTSEGRTLGGNVNIVDCVVSAKVSSADTNTIAKGSTVPGTSNYCIAGGLVGFTVRCDGLTLTIEGCTFDGSVDSGTKLAAGVGAVVGTGCNIVFKANAAGKNNNFSNAVLDSHRTTAIAVNSCIGYLDSATADFVTNGRIVFTNVPEYDATKYPAYGSAAASVRFNADGTNWTRS